MLEQDDNFTATQLSLELLNPYVSVDISEAYAENGETLTDKVTAVITVTEDLRFHSEYDSKFPDAEVFTEDGMLTEDGFRALEQCLTARYGAENVEFEGETPEDAFIRFELALEVPANSTLDELSERIWEDTKLVQFHNEADPGTFGSPYLFGSVIREFLTTLGAD